ncbi:transglutaminase family protein [Candidatus Eisenbacteria bacterium]|uniref:Transglutaminase family protein n=1 Tax=Eiseniibacteriota bacterium TaxID=2212470 RepID=A0ABV6YP32_UNCEI
MRTVPTAKTLGGILSGITALILCAATIAAAGIETEKIYFAIEQEGTPFGYSEIDVSSIEIGGRELILVKQKTFAMVTALGADVNTDLTLIYHLDPETHQFTYHESELKQAQLDLWSRVYVEGDKVRFVSNPADTTIIDLPPEVLLENTLIMPHLVRDFVDGGLTEKAYEVLDVREAEVHTARYTRAGIEDLLLAGEQYKALALDVLVPETALKYSIWVDTETGYLLKSKLPNGRETYRSGESIKKRIRTVSVDETLLAPVDVLIADIHSITYMTIRARIEPIGLQVSVEGLNVPGQTFTGTVENNVIDGIFEIEHPRYSGADAPPFPPDFSDDPAAADYLGGGIFMECEDPVLVEKAHELTEGSANCWEAAVRLSEWVSENIGYAIPGGGTPRKTYDIRAGECGAHSFLLATFCRTVGIPARVVWGCMYVPNQGGSFGQHAWNEIYMGEAGWIPVDATVTQARYLDSGHIRFGEYQSLTTSFNPHEMEILDYKLSTGDSGLQRAAVEKYQGYIGSYKHPAGAEDFEIFVREGNLTLNIPGQVALAFSEPDEAGKWQCKLSPKLYLEFDQAGDGAVSAMILHEILMMTRNSDPEEMPGDVPDDLRPYLGQYLFAQANVEFTVLYHEGGLAIYNPGDKQTVGLQPPDENGGWLDQYGKNTIYFDTESDGSVTALRIDAANRFAR